MSGENLELLEFYADDNSRAYHQLRAAISEVCDDETIRRIYAAVANLNPEQKI